MQLRQIVDQGLWELFSPQSCHPFHERSVNGRLFSSMQSEIQLDFENALFLYRLSSFLFQVRNRQLLFCQQSRGLRSCLRRYNLSFDDVHRPIDPKSIYSSINKKNRESTRGRDLIADNMIYGWNLRFVKLKIK